MEKGIVMEDMQRTYNEELSQGSGLMSLFRSLGDITLGEDIMDNLPMLMQALRNTNKDTLTMEQTRDMSGPIDESSLLVQLSNTPGASETIGEIPTMILSSLSPTPMGKGKGLGSLFDMFGDTFDPKKNKERMEKIYKDIEKSQKEGGSTPLGDALLEGRKREQKGRDIIQEGVDKADEMKAKVAFDDIMGKDDLDKALDRLKASIDRQGPRPRQGSSKLFGQLDNEGKRRIQNMLNERNKLNKELNEDMFMDPDKIKAMSDRVDFLEKQLLPYFPDIYRMSAGGRPGLYANINAKRKRIQAGSGETMRKPGAKGAPTKENFKQAATTARKAMGGGLSLAKGYYGKSYK